MKRGLPGRRGQTFRPAPVFQGTGTGSLPQLALPHAGTTSRLGRTHEASHRCPYNSGVNATLPSITLAPGGVEKTTTVEHPRLRLLPGALLPAHWLGGGLLNDRLPGIRQALAEGRLRLRTLPLNAPADSDWAHDRWLRGHPALAASSVPAGAAAAVRAFATAQASVPTDRAPAAPAALQPSADAPSTSEAPGWLLQPVTFRLTTDRMMLDPTPQRAVDAPMAERMIQAIAPLLADEGLEIKMQTPTRWLLRPRTGAAGWQLACTPIEAVGEAHIDMLMPQGPDAKRFLRLLNEVQMSWNLLTLNEPQDLPVNAIWPSGPAHAPVVDATRDLLARGLVVDERFLTARLAQDLSAWLDALPALDTWFADNPTGFACLLAGEHGLHWLHAPNVPDETLQLAGLMPQPGAPARSAADRGAASPVHGMAGSAPHATSERPGRTAAPVAEGEQPGWLARLGNRLRAWRGRSRHAQGHADGRNGTASQGSPSADPLDTLFRDEAP